MISESGSIYHGQRTNHHAQTEMSGLTDCASACSSILDVDGCLVYNTTGNPSSSGVAPAAIRPGIENHASVALRTPAADCSPGQAESRSQACCVVNARTGTPYPASFCRC